MKIKKNAESLGTVRKREREREHTLENKRKNEITGKFSKKRL